MCMRLGYVSDVSVVHLFRVHPSPFTYRSRPLQNVGFKPASRTSEHVYARGGRDQHVMSLRVTACTREHAHWPSKSCEGMQAYFVCRHRDNADVRSNTIVTTQSPVTASRLRSTSRVLVDEPQRSSLRPRRSNTSEQKQRGF
jgi:hypothetical protein